MIQRPLIKQEWTSFSLSVQTNGTPINSQMGLTTMVDSFIVCVPSTAANSVFIGPDAGVTTTSGLELLAGTSQNFAIRQEGRQMYELQYPLLNIQNGLSCGQDVGESIPVVLWDISQTYLVASAITVVSVAVFKAVYV